MCTCFPSFFSNPKANYMLDSMIEGDKSSYFFHDGFSLVKLGALEWIKVVRQHQGWRLVTCSWLHAGVLHLIANMLSLTFVGIRIERQFGLGKHFLTNKLLSFPFQVMPKSKSVNWTVMSFLLSMIPHELFINFSWSCSASWDYLSHVRSWW